MPTSLLRTKLYVPPLPVELVSRPRLLERLNDGMRRKLTVISAPPGFGKTTLLSEWVAGCEQPVAWVSLDEGENDPTCFWTYLIAALQTMQANIGDAALAALQSPKPPLIEWILTTLINDITEKPAAFVLVLDGYYVIETRAIHDALAFLLEHQPPHMHVVIAGRADPPLPLSRLRGRGQLTELRAADLRFTPDEAAAFLNEVMGLGLSHEDVAALEARTEGWIASLQLAALSMQGREDIPDFISAFSGSHRYILDYLTDEVLRRQEASDRFFLLETAILDRLTGPLCDAVTGRDDGQDMLEHLEAANLFIAPLDDERRWYRYHPLFADLLRSQLSRSQPDLLPTLHRRASEWFAREGLTAEAVDHALAANDFERAANLIEPIAQTLVTQSKLSTLLGWLANLPSELIAKRQWLCIWHAWASLLAGQQDAVEPLLQSAESGLRSAQEVQPPETVVAYARIHGHALAIRAYIARAQGDIMRTIELSHEAFRCLPENEMIARGGLALNLGYAYWMNGDMAAATHYLEEANNIGQAGGNLYVALAAMSYLADIQTEQGHLHQAADIYVLGILQSPRTLIPSGSTGVCTGR